MENREYMERACVIKNSGINYAKYECSTYRLKVDRDREKVIDNAGGLILKAAVVGLAGLAVYHGANYEGVFDQLTNFQYAGEMLGTVCGLSTAVGLNGLLGVKNSLVNIVEGYRDFRRDLRTYEYFRDEVKNDAGGKMR